MAYAAVVTLVQILGHILHPRLDRHQIPHDKQQIESLLENLKFFHDFLESSWRKQGMVVQCLERKIRGVAHKAQDTIETYISKHFLPESDKDGGMRCKIFVQDLELVIQEIDSIKKHVSLLMDFWSATCQHQTASLPTHPISRSNSTNEDLIVEFDTDLVQPKDLLTSNQYKLQKIPLDMDFWSATDQHQTSSLPTHPISRSNSTNENFIVGFDTDLVQLKDLLTSNQSKLQIIPIVGMGGTGKTALTKNLYNDDYIEYYFDIRAWITISQKYQKREILLGLLESMRKLSVEMCKESDDYLCECLYRSLKGRRYLIVMDDVWTTEVLSDMKMLLPDDNTGSRIMITTRLSDVATYAHSNSARQHHMHFLSDKESWNLLRRKVFMNQRCPPELEEVGKKIARSCKGLPLAIVVIAGLLIKVERKQWEHVAKNVNSMVIENDKQCSKVLSISYNHLPPHLKACFLYMGVFPEDHKIHISKLVKLWVAEGFMRPVSSKSLEEVAEEYLEDLISRNLILVGEKRIDGTIKTCSIHDLVRDLCLIKAREEKFLHAININTHVHGSLEGPRRLTIHGSSIAPEISNLTGTLSLVRTLLCPSLPRDLTLPGCFLSCKLLRVLDLGKLDFHLFPIAILELVHLTYLAFSFIETFHIPELLPDYLWNLQTLVINQRGDHNRITGTRVFWRMPQLRHLELEKFYLSCPAWENSTLENLQTLSKITSSSCTKDLIDRIPNLKKLGIWVEPVAGCDTQPFAFDNLMNLSRLEMLKCVVGEGARLSIPKNFPLPKNLKKLTLKRTRIPWVEMSAVGSLPNLVVLKLIENAFEGQEWETIDDGFCELKCLVIDGADLQYWRADRDHFPKLEYLRLWDCPKLEGIPCSIGDIPTLKMMELDDASPSAVTSAKQIQEEQQYLGNEELEVCIFNVWEIIQQQKMERERRQRMFEGWKRLETLRMFSEHRHAGWMPGWRM